MFGMYVAWVGMVVERRYGDRMGPALYSLFLSIVALEVDHTYPSEITFHHSIIPYELNSAFHFPLVGHIQPLLLLQIYIL